MASSITEIANLALTYIGADLITSLDDPQKSAILIKQNWPICRDAVLRAYPWNCAVKRDVLAPLADQPAYGWSYSFLLPPDCLRTLGLESGWSASGARTSRFTAEPFTIEGRKLQCNSNIVKIKYIARVEDPNEYDALLSQALAAYLAHLLAMPIVQSNSLKEQMWEQYKLAVREARSVDAQENSLQMVEATDWLESR